MIKQLFIVPDLAVKVVTGASCYPHEKGFSAISAEVAIEEPALVREVVYAQKSRHFVTFRCAMLDAGGKITGNRVEGSKTVFILSVEDIEYRKPGPAPVPTSYV